MTLYQWDSTLETGHPLIDGQHKQLVSLVNDMWIAYRDGMGYEKLEQILDFLTGYTIKHFSDEEKIQVTYKYPGYAQHKLFHNDFKQTVAVLTARLTREGASDVLVDEVCTTLGNWFVSHIQGEDFVLAAFIKAKDQEKTDDKL
jgi:hemerythrin